MDFSVLHQALQTSAHPLAGSKSDFDPLMSRVGDARLVLLGEATHGTHEFCRARAEITKRLICEKGFNAVVWGTDLADVCPVNRYVNGGSNDATGALDALRRFPAWTWRNTEVLAFVQWLRAYNDEHREGPVGVYGLDLFGLNAAMNIVVEHLSKAEPKAAARARQRYATVDHFPEGTHRYGFLADLGLSDVSGREVVSLLTELGARMSASAYDRDETGADDQSFFSAQRERFVRSAQEYYRMSFGRDVAAWNVREEQMTTTLEELVTHLDQRSRPAAPGERETAPAKVVVWEHNARVGDARATQRHELGEENFGQHVRQHYGPDAVLVGFTTYDGTLTTAADFRGRTICRRLRPAPRASYEGLLHFADVDRALFVFTPHAQLTSLLRQPRLERAIGAVYRPEIEDACHGLEARISEQFDAVVHFDRTRTVEPLDVSSAWASEGESIA